jgi:hypothetical protein
MLKKILKLEGTTELTREQKQKIKGGIACGPLLPPCMSGWHCIIIPDHDEGYCKQN